VADHNDPNAVNSIFSDIDVSAADVYDMFGYPSSDDAAGESVVVALTFAAIPDAGIFDSDMLYRIKLTAQPRLVRPPKEELSLETIVDYVDAVREEHLSEAGASEIRVVVEPSNRARVE
jgi:hypothetical protein